MIRDEVAPDQHLAEVPRELSVDVLLRGRELQVHVRVGGHQEPLVLHAPLELDDDGFARELVEERMFGLTLSGLEKAMKQLAK